MKNDDDDDDSGSSNDDSTVVIFIKCKCTVMLTKLMIAVLHSYASKH